MANTIAHIAEVGITAGQSGRLADRFITRCRTEGLPYPTQLIQDVVEQEGDQIVQQAFEDLRARVERRSKMIVRRVRINRSLSPMQLVDASKRVKYVNEDVLDTMPRKSTEGEEEVDMYFFNEGRYLSVDEQEKVLAEYGLEHDYAAQCQVNIDDPAFADEHPNGMQWRDSKNRPFFVAFGRGFDDERDVGCDRSGGGWGVSWWFGGVRKSSK